MEQIQPTARFLVVEDSPSQALQLKLILQHREHHVREAPNGEEALSLIAADRPDVVISDILMPVMDGYELCRRIKGDAATRDISVILLTKLSDTEDIVNGLKCGADSFISKPYSERGLLHHVDHILANRNLRNRKHPDGVKEVFLDGTRHLFSSGSTQIINFLFSTFMYAIEKSQELEQKNDELIKALRTIDTLRGLIPICAWCKKIRDDKGFWKNVEEYLMQHASAKFTHGMCPECQKKVAPVRRDTPGGPESPEEDGPA